MYLIDNKSLEFLEEIKQFDINNLIDWEKTKEKFRYKNSKSKLSLYDKKYGWFEVMFGAYKRGSKHKYHKNGSPKEHFDILKKLDIDELIDWEKTKNRFEYKGALSKIFLYDKKYGWFETTPNRFKQGSRHRFHTLGSPMDHFNEMVSLDIDEFIDWEKTKQRFDYIGNNKKVWLYDKIAGWYQVVPQSFKNGTRHNIRSTSHIDLSKPTILYLIEISNDDNILYKIGITTKDITEKRYTAKERKFITNKWEFKFKNGIIASNIEQKIKDKYRPYLIDKEDYPLDNGWTETFEHINKSKIIEDILEFKNCPLDTYSYTGT